MNETITGALLIAFIFFALSIVALDPRNRVLFSSWLKSRKGKIK